MGINQRWGKNPEKHDTINWIEKTPYHKGSQKAQNCAVWERQISTAVVLN